MPGDFIYDQLKSEMLQSGVLLRDTNVMIDNMAQEGPDGVLRARLCAAIFLINKLEATTGPAALGIQATAGTLADLLVQDLPAGSATLRQRIPEVLQKLVDEGKVLPIDGVYRLQTKESAEWESDYRARRARILADEGRIASDRATALQAAVRETLQGITLTQGANKTPRKFELHFGADRPKADTGIVPIWVRDEWSVSEKTVREDAQDAGVDSPIVFVFLPRRDADPLKEAVAAAAAATETLQSRPRPTTPEGENARAAMESRGRAETSRLKGLVSTIVSQARVFQGGGTEVAEPGFPTTIRTAVEAALVRLFPEFGITDMPGWAMVVKRAGDGATDALTAVGYNGDVEKHPACQRIRAFIGGTGRKGLEIRKQFMGDRYGWPQDAVDGALLALVAGGFVRASRNGQPLPVKAVGQAQIGVTDFVSEGVTISGSQRLAVRKLITDLGLPCKAGEEIEALPRVLARLAELATAAGGEPPLPARPSTALLESLQATNGNPQIVAVYDARDELLQQFQSWSQASAEIGTRRPHWQRLESFLALARDLPVAEEVAPQVEAIRAGRALLTDPDPVSPLLARLTAALRQALQAAHERLRAGTERELAGLQAMPEWEQLADPDRRSILATVGLGEVPALHIGTDEELLAALQATALADWEGRSVALPARAARARDEIARRVAPQAVRVHLPPATLKTVAEVESYLAELRGRILAEIEAGKPVIM